MCVFYVICNKRVVQWTVEEWTVVEWTVLEWTVVSVVEKSWSSQSVFCAWTRTSLP